MNTNSNIMDAEDNDQMSIVIPSTMTTTTTISTSSSSLMNNNGSSHIQRNNGKKAHDSHYSNAYHRQTLNTFHHGNISKRNTPKTPHTSPTRLNSRTSPNALKILSSQHQHQRKHNHYHINSPKEKEKFKKYVLSTIYSKDTPHPQVLQLIKASTIGDLNQLKCLLNNYSSIHPNAVDERGRSALHFASIAGHLPIVQELLSHGADPNLQDVNGNTALHLAVVSNHAHIVQFLLISGANPNCNDRFQKTPLDLVQSRIKLLTDFLQEESLSYSHEDLAMMNTKKNEMDEEESSDGQMSQNEDEGDKSDDRDQKTQDSMKEEETHHTENTSKVSAVKHIVPSRMIYELKHLISILMAYQSVSSSAPSPTSKHIPYIQMYCPDVKKEEYPHSSNNLSKEFVDSSPKMNSFDDNETQVKIDTHLLRSRPPLSLAHIPLHHTSFSYNDSDKTGDSVTIQRIGDDDDDGGNILSTSQTDKTHNDMYQLDISMLTEKLENISTKQEMNDLIQDVQEFLEHLKLK